METLDLNKLAKHLRGEIDSRGLSLREAALEIGCSASTLSRMLQGAEAPNTPESRNLVHAAQWLGKALSDFEQQRPKRTTITDVELHLRALPDLRKAETEALVGMVKAAYEHATKSKRRSKR